MLPHLCPAVDPVLVQPHIPHPRLLHYQVFGSVLIRLPHCCLHSSPLLLFQSPSQTPFLTFRKQLQVLRQRTGFLAVCPSAFPVAHLTRVSGCAVLWGPFSPRLSVHTGPLSQSQGAMHRTHREDGTCHFSHSLQGAPVPSVFPQPSGCP